LKIWIKNNYTMHQLKAKITALLSNNSLSGNQLLKQLKEVVKEREIALNPLQKSASIIDLFSTRLTQIIEGKTEAGAGSTSKCDFTRY